MSKKLEERYTVSDTAYVSAPRAVIVGGTQFYKLDASNALEELFDAEASGVVDYRTSVPYPENLAQYAGQLCYLSFDEKRTPLMKNREYLERIMSSAHGSVLEHVSYSILFFGIDRATTHELIRHRAGTAYCLTGDTLIYSERGATAGHKLRTGAKKRSLKSLFEMTQTHHGRSRLKLLRLRVLDETSGTFVRGKVKAVVCSGEKPVFKVTLQDGRTITSTKEHRFLTADGWSSLSDIVGGLSVVGDTATYTHLDTPIKVNGVEAYKDRDWLDEQYNPMWKGGVTPARMKIAQDCDKFRTAVYARDQHTCRLCRLQGGKLILHHVLPVWYRPDLATTASNLVTVCQDCHENRINNHELDFVEYFGIPLSGLPPGLSRKTGVGNRMHARSMRIKRIEYAGVQMTYDIEMDGPNHNFVANGIVTHNSQVSQRYVDDEHLRFVMPFEYLQNPKLQARFEKNIDRASEEYRALTEELQTVMPRRPDESKTEYRKRIQSCSREVLPNSTEAPIIVTANIRAWRHMFNMRCSEHADVRIRRPMIAALELLMKECPNFFFDFEIKDHTDGSKIATCRYNKV